MGGWAAVMIMRVRAATMEVGVLNDEGEVVVVLVVGATMEVGVGAKAVMTAVMSVIPSY